MILVDAKIYVEQEKWQGEIASIISEEMGEEILERSVDLPQYDMIVIPYMISNLKDEEIRLLIDKLLPRVNQ